MNRQSIVWRRASDVRIFGDYSSFAAGPFS